MDKLICVLALLGLASCSGNEPSTQTTNQDDSVAVDMNAADMNATDGVAADMNATDSVGVDSNADRARHKKTAKPLA